MKNAFFFVGALVFSSLSAESSVQNGQMSQDLNKKKSSAYNAPASVKLKDPYLLFGTASYLYWCASEDGLDLATTAAFIGSTNSVVPSPHRGKVIFQDFDYSSGFKVGLGANLQCDDWVIRADYTRLHQTTSQSESASASTIGVGALYLTNWFFQVSAQNQGIAATHFSSTWHLGLDWLDVVLEKSAYSGRRLTLTPFMGLRTSWIEQSLQIRARGALNVSPSNGALHSRNNLHSWGIGPRAGIQAYFLLGMGFNLQGDLGASLLFNRFSKVSHSEDPFVADGFKVSYAIHNYNSVRPMAEANVGLNWGIYLANERYHLSLSATYDFNYLWSQNMLRILNDLEMEGTGGAASDLSFQGLTVTTRFDF